MPIISYQNIGVRDVAEDKNSKAAWRSLPRQLHRSARLRLAVIDAMISLDELSVFPGWRLERLRGDRLGQYSIRINAQFRICFEWDGKDAANVRSVFRNS